MLNILSERVSNDQYSVFNDRRSVILINNEKNDCNSSTIHYTGRYSIPGF